VLCHAMAPQKEGKEDLVSSTASVFETPASSPRWFCSAISQGTCTPPLCPSEAQVRSPESNDDVAVVGEWVEVPARCNKKTQKAQRVSKDSAKHGQQPRLCDRRVASPSRFSDRIQEEASKPRYVKKHEVGIKDDEAFHVVRRLLGPGGENLKHITAESNGAKVWICGDGSRRTEGARDRDPLGPLAICASATSHASLDEASALIQDLLKATREDHARFLSCKTSAPSAAVADKAWPFAASLLVGIEEDAAFQVVKRLVGKGGRNMKRIESLCNGASVRLAGRRRAHSDASDGPLEMQVNAETRESFNMAVKFVRELLKQVHEEYSQFCLGNGHQRDKSRRPSDRDALCKRFD